MYTALVKGIAHYENASYLPRDTLCSGPDKKTFSLDGAV